MPNDQDLSPGFQFLAQQGLLPDFVTKEAAAETDVNVPLALCANADPSLPVHTEAALFRSMIRWHEKSASAELPGDFVKVASAFGILPQLRQAHEALLNTQESEPAAPPQSEIQALKFAAFFEDTPVYPCAHNQEIISSCAELERDMLDRRVSSFEAAKVAKALATKSASLGVKIPHRISRLALDPGVCFDLASAKAEAEQAFKVASTPVPKELQDVVFEGLEALSHDITKSAALEECLDEAGIDNYLDLRKTASMAEILRDPAMHEQVMTYHKSAVFLAEVPVPVDAILAQREKASAYMSVKAASAFKDLVTAADSGADVARDVVDKMDRSTQEDILHILARLS